MRHLKGSKQAPKGKLTGDRAAFNLTYPNIMRHLKGSKQTPKGKPTGVRTSFNLT